MNRPVWLPWIAVFALVASFPAVAHPPTTYRVTHICTNDPTNPSVGCNVADINNKGELVGSRPLNGVPQVAFIWRRGEFTNLNALLMNTKFAFALAINDHSEVVGQFDDAQSRQTAFIWRHGEISRIQVGPGRFASSAADINKRREVLLIAFTRQGVAEWFVWRARDGRLTRLELLPGLENFMAPLRLNDRGAAVGTAPGGRIGVLPFLWEDGTLMQIQLPQGARGGDAVSINDRGVITGFAVLPGHTAGYRWRDGRATELPSTPILEDSQPLDINNHDVVVGFSFNLDEERIVATRWPRRGGPVDLNTRIADDDPLKPFLYLASADLINDRGQIVASGYDSRNDPFATSHYLLTPVRER